MPVSPQEKGAELSGPTVPAEVRIPIGSNSWSASGSEAHEGSITVAGLQKWSDPEATFRTYFKTANAGRLTVGLQLKVPEGTSKLRFTLDGQVREVTVSGNDYQDLTLEPFTVDSAGYHGLEIEGISRSGAYFADLSTLVLSGPAAGDDVVYVPREEFYFGRRGPSVHWGYELPTAEEVEWFYGEVEVPEGSDVIGSYFMANGFAEGYFGMQVNSPTERRILFSVWSPYETQDPNEIPEEYRIILLGKGEDVTTGEFGNEGSGGQSYLRYPWRAGNTYRFLLSGRPAEHGSTDFTAYFYAPEVGEWQLIAGFRRPKTTTYLTRLYSFLENFYPSTGDLARRVAFGNQWARTVSGGWHEVVKAKHTADATARNGYRKDYQGWVDGNQFCLKNCGFFDDPSTLDVVSRRAANGRAPSIDLSALPAPSGG